MVPTEKEEFKYYTTLYVLMKNYPSKYTFVLKLIKHTSYWDWA